MHRAMDGDGTGGMGENDTSRESGSSSHEKVKREIEEFFAANPFLMVCENRLASLLCRPPRLVEMAVRELERDGCLERRDAHTLVGGS